MNGYGVLQRYDAKNADLTVSWIENLAPETNTPILLNLRSQRMGDDYYAPIGINIRPLSQDLLGEVARRPHLHVPSDAIG